jgi:signal recognition particle subunit SRP54
MFDTLTDKLTGLFKNLTGQGKLSESNVREAAQQVRRALLEADVNFRVVKDFIAAVEARALGEEVLNSVTPGQQFIKVVHDQLTQTLGGRNEPLRLASQPPTVIMVCGLQGSGKTTTCAKLARHLAQPGRRIMLAAADIHRPAAVEQLRILSGQAGCEFFSMDSTDVPAICDAARDEAVKRLIDVLVLDTAGRLHVDDELMAELERVQAAVRPHQVLLVVDGMTGQDAVNVAAEFDRRLPLTGVVMTKLDGDSRGGAALSLRAVAGKPLMFAGTGEKLEALEPFYPDRMASRILGMGDVVGLVEKAQAVFDAKAAEQLERKVRKSTFDLEDFAEQLRQVRKMGPLSDVVGMIPGMAKLPAGAQPDDGALTATLAIIGSMTKKERARPQVLDGSRKRRIAAGSGTSVQQVNQLLRQFELGQRMMKQFASGRMKGIPRGGF